MSVRELLLRALNQQPVERIPVSPFIHVNYVKEFFGSHDVDLLEGTTEVYDHFGFDLMHRNCTPAYDSGIGAFTVGTDTEEIDLIETPEWQVQVATIREGRDETTTTVVTTPEGELSQVWNVRWVHEYDTEVALTDFPIKSEHDLELCKRYIPPVGPADTSDIRRAKELVGDKGVVAPWIQGAFNLVSLYYRKPDELMVDALVRPAFYHELMEFFLSRFFEYVIQMIEAGADVLGIGGNVANGKLVGPDFFTRYIAPYERRLVDFIQSRGVIALYHNCGYSGRLLELYPGLGFKAYESLTPLPYGDTILERALKVFEPGTITLLGNIDQVDLLRYGTEQEIEAAVRQTMQAAKEWGGHFILATSDYFNEDTPHDNLHLLAEVGKKYSV
jgi:uroporphyrinogen decarboxylase